MTPQTEAGQNGELREPATGRYKPGTRPGPGRPKGSSKQRRLREGMLRKLRHGDVRAVIDMLLEQAKGGNIVAAKELLDRACGRAISPAVPLEDQDGTMQFTLGIQTPTIEVVYRNRSDGRDEPDMPKFSPRITDDA